MYEMIVMIPHPDDEILACTYWLCTAVQYQYRVLLVYFTDGENDLIGELLAYCDQTLCKVCGMYVSAAVKLVPIDGSFKFFSVVMVQNENHQPLPHVEINVLMGDTAYSTMTNELGYACFASNTKISSLTIQGIHLPENMLHPVPSSFRKEYGELRFQESMHALSILGLCAEIQRIQLKDGGLPYLSTTQKELLETTLCNLLEASPNATVLIPHEKDADTDHSVISRMVQQITKKDQVLIRYIVHCSLNHKAWPDPAYHFCRNDRIATCSMRPPLADEEFIEKMLNREQKQVLIECFKTQLRSDEYGFLLAFAKENEFFYPK